MSPFFECLSVTDVNPNLDLKFKKDSDRGCRGYVVGGCRGYVVGGCGGYVVGGCGGYVVTIPIIMPLRGPSCKLRLSDFQLS